MEGRVSIPPSARIREKSGLTDRGTSDGNPLSSGSVPEESRCDVIPEILSRSRQSLRTCELIENRQMPTFNFQLDSTCKMARF